jgi:hypothetical protein
MKAMVTKYGGVAGRLAGPMTRAQTLRLKSLAEEAYQPEQFGPNLSFDEVLASQWQRRSNVADPCCRWSITSCR